MVAMRVPAALLVLSCLIAAPAGAGDYVPPFPIHQAPGAPEPPESIRVGGTAEEGAEVSWTASSSAGVDGYRVYWATVDGWASMDVTDTTATLPGGIQPFVTAITVTSLAGALESRASEFAVSPVADTTWIPEYPYCDWLVVYVGPVSPPDPPVWIRYRLECLVPEP